MAREKSVLNSIIDKSIGRLVSDRGSEGFSYEDVEFRVRSELGELLDSTLVELGHSKLRDRIRQRATSMVKGQIEKLDPINPGIWDDDASLVYPVKDDDGKTVFKQAAHLNQNDFDEIIRDLLKQRRGLDRHIKALRRIEAKLKTIWNKHPEWDIATAQQYLDPEAA